MLRSGLIRLVLASTLLLGFVPFHAAKAAEPVLCQAHDVTSLQGCVTQLNDGTNAVQGIEFTAMVTCTVSDDCGIYLQTGKQSQAAVTIEGDPARPASATGIKRTGNFDYNVIHVRGWSNVTLKRFTIDEEPSDTQVVLDSPAIFCTPPPGFPQIGCAVPGYATLYDSDAGLYSDWNTECYNFHVNGNPNNHFCPHTIYIDGTDSVTNQDITISGVIINHSQGQAIWAWHTTGFYLLDSTVMNSFFRALTISATDVSIEGNTFFANRAAAIHGNITSSYAKRPSDISNNVFNHNQHGDAYGDGGHEGVSGAQIAIEGTWQDVAFYGNSFLNGYMDFYDPQVFDEQIGQTDPFSQCDLSVRCVYYNSSGDLTPAGLLWTNGGGVESGPDAHGDEGNSHHMVPAVDVDGPMGTHVVFSNNGFNFGSGGIVNYTIDPVTGPKLVFFYRNQFFQNTAVINPIAVQNPVEYEDTCAVADCQAVKSDTSPDIVMAIQVSPTHTTGGVEDKQDCGGKNCITVLATGAWQQQYNSLALDTGTDILCALGVYDATNTLVATLQGSNAHCNAGGALFYIPGTVAEHYTDVKVSFQNLSTGQSSPKLAMTWTDMVPILTGAGLGCSNSQCIWITATDTDADNCAVGLYAPTTLAFVMTLKGSQVHCNGDGVTFVIPQSILANYSAIDVNYQNLTQGTWSKMKKVTLPVSGGGTGGGDPGTGNQ